MTVTRIHVDNLSRSATPGALAKHLGLMTMGPDVRVDLVFDSVTGRCGGQGVVTVPSDKVNVVLEHHQSTFLDEEITVSVIPNVTMTNIKSRSEAVIAAAAAKLTEVEEAASIAAKIAEENAAAAVALSESLRTMNVGEKGQEQQLASASASNFTPEGDYIAGFQNLDSKPPGTEPGSYKASKEGKKEDANNNSTKKDSNKKKVQAQSGKKKTLLTMPHYTNGYYSPSQYDDSVRGGYPWNGWGYPMGYPAPPGGPPFDYNPRPLPQMSRRNDQAHPAYGGGDGSLPFKYRMIDAAAILTHPRLIPHLNTVVSRAHSVGVESIVTLGMDIKGTKEAKRVAEAYPHQVYFTTGFHPHNARRWKPEFEAQLEALAKSPYCVGIGETGLDFARDFSPRDVQVTVFEAQVKLACKLKKPLILHVRDAGNEVREILSKYLDDLPQTLVHCFSGDRDDALKWLAMGFYFGITGFVCKAKNSQGLRAVLSECEIPEDKLILETDCPFMFPNLDANFPEDVKEAVKPSTTAIINTINHVINDGPSPWSWRKRRYLPKWRNVKKGIMGDCNEPSLLPMVVEVVAGFMKKTPEHVAELAYNNAKRFYGI